jgi:sec-independent protein translocase protein TatC
MATALRPVGHDDKLSIVDHLDELRSRLIICVVALVVTSAFCYWQNANVLDVLNRPLETRVQGDSNRGGADRLEGAAAFNRGLGAFATRAQEFARAVGREPDLSAATRESAEALARSAEAVARAAPAAASNQPITLGVAEPFTTTLRVSFYAGLLLALPLLLYQAYAFVLPAFTPGERKVALPLMLMVPVLFLGGVAFGYYVVLDRAIAFLQNFNDDAFDINVQAKDYYGFVIFFVGSIGLLFQVPVGVLAITRTGIVTTRQLRKNRGYVILAIAILAAVATPTPDPITMTLAMGPLVILFELSIWLAAWLNRVKPPEPDEEPVATLDWDDDDRED